MQKNIFIYKKKLIYSKLIYLLFLLSNYSVFLKIFWPYSKRLQGEGAEAVFKITSSFL